MRFLRLPDVQSKVGLGKTEIYARINSGEFPAPIKLGTASRWVEDELDAWMTRVVEQSKRSTTQRMRPTSPTQRIKPGKFSAPTKLGAESHRVVDELDAWMARVVEQSPRSPAP